MEGEQQTTARSENAVHLPCRDLELIRREVGRSSRRRRSRPGSRRRAPAPACSRREAPSPGRGAAPPPAAAPTGRRRHVDAALAEIRPHMAHTAAEVTHASAAHLVCESIELIAIERLAIELVREARRVAGKRRRRNRNVLGWGPVPSSPDVSRTAANVQRHAFERDPVHQAPLAVVVVQGVVPGRAVVPERDRAFFPMEAGSSAPGRWRAGRGSAAADAIRRRSSLRSAA